MPALRDSTVTFFPVGNGDTTLIALSDGATMLIDLNVINDADDEADGRYDVHDHLQRELRRDESGRLHLDVFILSHPDQDHIRGIERVLYLGNPESYSQSDDHAGLIIVDELWFAPRVFSGHEELSSDANLFRNEAERRLNLHKAGNGGTAGNRLRVIGYTDNPDLEGLEDITTVPGNTLNFINGLVRDDFCFFVHAPFRAEADGENSDRNDASVILQAQFAVGEDDRAVLLMLGGDAGAKIWERVVAISEPATLEWDLLLAPHHCSWSFFSEESSDGGEPNSSVQNFLAQRRQGASVIASSKPIVDDDNNPPHHRAAGLYRAEVGSSRLLCTMEHPSVKSTTPIHFSVTANGPVKDELATPSSVKSSAARRSAISNPKTYG